MDSGLLRPRLSDVFLLVFGATCQQGSSVTPRSHSSRIITITAFVILMFLYENVLPIDELLKESKNFFQRYTSYAANIVALLQSPSTKIKSLKDLLDSRLKFGVDDTVFNHYYFSVSARCSAKRFAEILTNISISMQPNQYERKFTNKRCEIKTEVRIL